MQSQWLYNMQWLWVHLWKGFISISCRIVQDIVQDPLSPFPKVLKRQESYEMSDQDGDTDFFHCPAFFRQLSVTGEWRFDYCIETNVKGT